MVSTEVGSTRLFRSTARRRVIFQIKKISNRKLTPCADRWERGAEKSDANKARETHSFLWRCTVLNFCPRSLLGSKRGYLCIALQIVRSTTFTHHTEYLLFNCSIQYIPISYWFTKKQSVLSGCRRKNNPVSLKL